MPTEVQPKARFRMEPIAASNRPKHYYRYFVSGRGVFPYDMLRYDAAWPATGEDAAKLDFPPTSTVPRTHRSIELRSYQPPTVERWASFMWSVGTDKLHG